MRNKLNDNEVQVGPVKIGPDTILQVNLKTLIVIIGILISGLTTAWWNLSDSIGKSNASSTNDIKELKDELKELKNQDLKTISIQLNQVDGKVQGIFMHLQEAGPSTPVVRTTNRPANLVPGAL